MTWTILKRLWCDDRGAILATEYLTLGTIVALGSAAGLTELRDSMNNEYHEFGNSVRSIRQNYAVPAAKGSSGSHGGTVVTNANAAQNGQQPVAIMVLPSNYSTPAPQWIFSSP